MNVLILGGGGREHALAMALAKSPSLSRLFVAPGNPGCAALAENVALPIDDHAAIVDFCRAREIGLVVVGPEAPLVAGVVDDLAAAGILCFGPSKAAARLEGSKGFAKDFCREFGIPTGDYRRLADAASALAYVRAKGAPIVVKADGLAAGKGVVVAMTLDEAEQAIQSMFAGAFGGAGAQLVVEDYLDGEELSFFALCDGTRAVAFAGAQDHKRVGDGDAGPNTGGMGAYSPAPIVTPAVHARIMAQVIEPTLRGLASDGIPYTGFLYAGLMIAPDGTPNVLEFNCRFGDPETQPIMMRLRSDLTPLCEAALDGKLDACDAVWDSRAALGVVMAAGGYPETYRKGERISGLDVAARLPGKVFHAGTQLVGSDILTSGGRVLCAVGLGMDVRAAQRQAYDLVGAIHWNLVQYRRDIGYRAIERET